MDVHRSPSMAWKDVLFTELFIVRPSSLSEEFGIKTINFKQEISPPEEAAQKLHQHLKSHGLEI